MKRRFQVFVSSTFEDLRDERQAAVEAILKAGHIPAGMELFTASSESQLEVIRQWIRDSDVYMLILGGRYGSIEPKSGLSYTEVEFEYARELNKPFFSVVLSEAGREAKVKAHGTKVLEQANLPKYQEFRTRVCAHMCAFFSTPQDVKLAVFETLPQITSSRELTGWVPASEVGPSDELARELARSLEENRLLRSEFDQVRRRLESLNASAPSFDQLFRTLYKEQVEVPPPLSGSSGPERQSLLELALAHADDLARGVANNLGATKRESFLMYNVASRLASYGLVEHAKVPASVHWQRLKLSKEGVKFMTHARIKMADVGATRPGDGGVTSAPTIEAPSTDGAPEAKSTQTRRVAKTTSSKRPRSAG